MGILSVTYFRRLSIIFSDCRKKNDVAGISKNDATEKRVAHEKIHRFTVIHLPKTIPLTALPFPLDLIPTF